MQNKSLVFWKAIIFAVSKIKFDSLLCFSRKKIWYFEIPLSQQRQHQLILKVKHDMRIAHEEIQEVQSHQVSCTIGCLHQ